MLFSPGADSLQREIVGFSERKNASKDYSDFWVPSLGLGHMLRSFVPQMGNALKISGARRR
jgi:hypothetical protein